MTTTDKQRRAYDYLEELAEGSVASAKSFLHVLFNRLSADDFIDMAETEFEWEDVEDEDDAEDEDSEDEDNEDSDDEPEYEAGRTCGMCGDELGNGQCIAWIDEDRHIWSVHENCYRGGRYLSLEDYCASEARKVAMNDSVSSLDKQALYPETDATGVLYRG